MEGDAWAPVGKMDREMAVKLFQRAGQSKLLQIISEWLVDYGINNIWRDFKETGSMSVVWKGVVQGSKQNRIVSMCSPRLQGTPMCVHVTYIYHGFFHVSETKAIIAN